MFKHLMKEMKTMQTIKHLMIQKLRFLIFQLHHCNINGPIIKIVCLREISRLRKNSILEEKSIFITIWTSRKEFHRWNFQTDERVDTSVAIKSYRLWSNYSNAESPFTKTFTKIEIKRSLEIIGKSTETMAYRRNHGVVERSRDHSERLKEYLIHHQSLRKYLKNLLVRWRRVISISAMKLLPDNMQNGILPLND